MSPAARTAHWLTLGTSILILIAGAVAARISSSPSVGSVRLSPGESVSLSAFRFRPDTTRVALQFDRKPGELRAELGNHSSKRGTNYIEFESPGEPIRLHVRGPTTAADFEAMPAGSFSANNIDRELIVAQSDSNPRRFLWPPDNSLRPKLPTGSSKITITVLEVGAALSGERVGVVLEPPLSFKTAMPGYGFLWWFLFWPVFAALLAAYAGVLIWQSVKSPARQPQSEA